VSTGSLTQGFDEFVYARSGHWKTVVGAAGGRESAAADDTVLADNHRRAAVPTNGASRYKAFKSAVTRFGVSMTCGCLAA